MNPRIGMDTGLEPCYGVRISVIVLSRSREVPSNGGPVAPHGYRAAGEEVSRWKDCKHGIARWRCRCIRVRRRCTVPHAARLTYGPTTLHEVQLGEHTGTPARSTSVRFSRYRTPDRRTRGTLRRSLLYRILTESLQRQDARSLVRG